MQVVIRDITTGRTLLDSNSRLGRFLGKLEITGSSGNGQVEINSLANGNPFAFFFSDGTGSIMVMCDVTVSGTTIKWEFKGNGANTGTNNPSGYIMYGVF
ncbi:hypothetical protein GCM10010946_21870 [Undibacterium squillarum]|uniref:Uncharacterized protein n=1 Tax=Undibacterium squillarum TaxID=1131567 RepID=A0ABQ2XZ16_9BURK|nr:hypothetical protein GCM10010946_21870 [Undibacterium squillarum]